MSIATSSGSDSDHTAEFERHRPRLFGIAYRMLGDVEDARDLVQETYLRWHRSDREALCAPEGWLVAVISRLAIDRLRRAETERSAYVGTWLPEPIATEVAASPDRDVELASDLSMAFLVLLERLAPDERAAFLLREVFETDYEEIARILERSEAAVRQIVHRARTRVRSERSRFHAAPDSKERLLQRFLDAIEAGDQDALLSVFAEHASFTSDGGGKAPATRNVLTGSGVVTRFLMGIEQKWRGHFTHAIQRLNGEAAIVSRAGGRIFAVTAVEADGDRIVAMYRVLNPDKLRNVGGEVFDWETARRGGTGM